MNVWREIMFAKMAWRNIWRNKRRTVITLVVMSFSCMIMLIFICGAKGYYAGIITNSVKAGMGHIQIHQQGFFAMFTPRYYIRHDPALLEVLNQDKAIKAYALRIKGAGLVSHTSKSQNVTILGIQPDKEPGVSVFHQKRDATGKGPLVEGDYIQKDDWQEGFPKDEKGIEDTSKTFRYPGILIGEKLRQKFDIKVGSEVIVTIQSLTGEIKQSKLMVRGIFRTLIPEYDQATAIVHYQTAQKLFGYLPSSPFHETDIKDFDSLREKLQKRATPWSQYLWSRFSAKTKQLLKEYDPKNSVMQRETQKAVCAQLSQALNDKSMYNSKRFPEVTTEIKKLSEQKPKGEELSLLNRLLLEHVYPEITKRPLDGYFSEIVILATDNKQMNPLARRLREKFKTDEYEVLSWSQINPNLVEFIAIDSFFMYFSIGMLFVVTSMGVLITLLMAIFERVREFGIMRAIGMVPARLAGLIFMESLWLGLIGCLIGGLLAAVPLYLLVYHGLDVSKLVPAGKEVSSMIAISLDPVIYGQADLVAILGCFSFLVTITLLVTLYPVAKAIRMNVVDALTFV